MAHADELEHCGPPVPLHLLVEPRAARQVVHEHFLAGQVGSGLLTLQDLQRTAVEFHEPRAVGLGSLLVFGEHLGPVDEHGALNQVNVGPHECDLLADPQAGEERELKVVSEHGVFLFPSGEDQFNLFGSERVRVGALHLEVVDTLGGVFDLERLAHQRHHAPERDEDVVLRLAAQV